jgi:hypothetical protein
VSPDVSKVELLIALRESVRLQSNYARRLNLWERGYRFITDSPEAWIARLRETGHLPRRPKGRKQRAEESREVKL